MLVNLLANAVRYGRPGGGLRLTVRLDARRLAWRSGTRDRDSREPNAPGCFASSRACSTPTADQRRGTGLGLYNSWRIVQLHHGHIRADARPGEWAEFTFEIPQPLCAADIADELEPSE